MELDYKMATDASSGDRDAQAATRSGCVFCRIVAKDQQASIVYEDADYMCFRDRRPSATHHYLLVPRDHIRCG